jgi:plastocyanin
VTLLFSAEQYVAAAEAYLRGVERRIAAGLNPQVLTVKAGDTIMWVNRDPFPHTATAEGKQFDSHEIASGRSWKYTARKTGEFAYACVLHPTMKATLRVE